MRLSQLRLIRCLHSEVTVSVKFVEARLAYVWLSVVGRSH